MNDNLTLDQFDALAQIGSARKSERPSACVARNIKTLAGLKYVRYEKNGGVSLTEKGQETLFIRRCIAGMRAVANDSSAKLDADVVRFLTRKGHIAQSGSLNGLELTQRGKESLADMDATGM
jgi:hypothetical protein